LPKTITPIDPSPIPSKNPEITQILPTKSEVTTKPKQSLCSPMLSGNKIIFPDIPFESSNTKNITTLLDSFNNNNNEWPVGSWDTTYSTRKEYIQNGKYCVDIIGKRDVTLFNTLNSQDIEDAEISLDGYKASGTSGSDFAVIFRFVNSSNYYMFGINEYYQDYFFSVIYDDEWVDIINKERRANIVTIEDPIEYLFKEDKSIAL
jgi:hypothetical protein